MTGKSYILHLMNLITQHNNTPNP